MTVLARATLPSVASPLVLGMLGASVFMSVYSTQTILPELSLEFQAPAVAAGATVGATTLAMALMSPVMGLLADGIGRKRVLIATLFLLALPGLLAAHTESLQGLVLWRFVQGLIIPGITVVTLAYVSEEFPKSSMAKVLACYVSGTVLGGFLGRLITGFITEHFGWRHAFEVLAGLNVLGGLLCLWLLPASQHFVPQRNWKRAISALGNHLQNRLLVAANLVGFSTLFSLTGLFTYINYHLSGAPFKLGPAALGTLFCVYLIGMVVTPLAGGWISKLGNRTALTLAMMVSSTGILLTLSPALPLIVLGLVLCSSGVFVAQAAATSFVAAHATHSRSLASGLYNLSYYGGGAVSTLLTGWAFTQWGWTGAVLTVLVAQLLAALTAQVGWKRA